MSSLAPFAEWLCAVLLSAGALPASVTIEEDPNATEVHCKALQAPKDPEATRALQKVQPSERLAQQDTLGHLAVQHALREGKKLLDDQRYEDAIRVLEPHLAKANGSEEFLEALEAAYRGQTSYLINRRELDAARLVAQRLRILSPSDELSIPEKTDVRTLASLAAASNGPSERKPSADKSPKPSNPKEEPPAAPARPIGRALVETVVNASSAIAAVALDKAPSPSASTETEPATPAVKPAVAVARGRMEEPGEEIQTASLSRVEKPSFLDQADRHFQTGRFGDALACYERAYQEDPVSVQAGRERWGYCLLYVTVERYNEFVQGKRTVDSPDVWEHLESDVKLSRRLAPSLKYADTVLEAIQKQKQPAPPAAKEMTAVAAQTPKSTGTGPGVDQYRGAIQQPVPSRNLVHLPGRSQSWSVAETRNFRIYHRNPSLAEQVGKLAEEAREFAHQKWFPGEPMEDWNPICEVYLYPTAHEYSQSTGVPPQSPGHTKVLPDNGRIISRNLNLRTDDPNMLEAVLPHEVVHVVLAGRFGVHAVPRWADEGMAVLTEPRSKQEGHLVNLVQARRKANGFSCAQMLAMGDYPPGNRMRDFYAHSVGICRYLVEIGGTQKLVTFLRTALQSGNYEVALQQIYGLNFNTLEGEFNRYVASLENSVSPVQTAQQNPVMPNQQFFR